MKEEERLRLLEKLRRIKLQMEKMEGILEKVSTTDGWRRKE